MFIRALAGAAVLAVSTVAQSAPLQPTGKWIVHFDDSQCLAERNYGPEDHPIYLTLKKPVLGDVIQVDIIESRYSSAPAQLAGKIEFSGHPPFDASILRYSPSDQKYRIHMMNLPAKKVESARMADSLSIKAGPLDETFAISQIGPLLDVLDKCAAELGKLWNVKGSGDVRDDIKGDLRKLISTDDYPWDAVIGGDSGVVLVALLVNEEGRVADCSVIQTSGAAMLDAQSCAILKKRARFTPAVGNDGKPAKDSFIQRINWRLVI